MALYRATSKILIGSIDTKEFYRFEGAKSLSRFKLERGNKGDYIYISNSLDHHMYFAIRRIKQLIDQKLYETDKERFAARTVRDEEVYSAIKKLVLYGDLEDTLYSKRIICAGSYNSLIRENCIRNDQPKHGKRHVERVDRRVYGGGYGVADEWKDLLRYLTFFTATTRLNREDIMHIISEMKRTGKITSKDHMRSITNDYERYQYRVNPNILNDFNKYDILNALEVILEKGLVMPTSELSKDPKQATRRIIDEYEIGREITIKTLEKKL